MRYYRKNQAVSLSGGETLFVEVFLKTKKDFIFDVRCSDFGQRDSSGFSWSKSNKAEFLSAKKRADKTFFDKDGENVVTYL